MEEMSRRLGTNAEMLKLVVASNPEPGALQTALQSLSRRLESRFTVIRGDGRVIADSDHDPAGMDNHNNRPEVRQARAEGTGTERRYSDTLHLEMVYHAILTD